MPRPAQHPLHDSPAPLPPWAKDDASFKQLPEPHQHAIVEILQPLYERFVLYPADHLERSTGNSVIYLLWNELLKQAEIATSPYDDSGGSCHRRILMDDLFLILSPKFKMSSLLLNIRRAMSKLQQDDTPCLFPFAALPGDDGFGRITPPLTNSSPLT